MASDFPASLDAFPDPLVNSPLNSPSHAALHQDVNDAVEKIEVKLGVGVSDADDASVNQVLMADGAGGSAWESVTNSKIDTVGVPAQRVLASDGSGGASWVSNESGMIKITPTSVSGTGASIGTDGNVVVLSGGSNVTVNGIFSSLFRTYKIICTDCRATSATATFVALGTSNTGTAHAYAGFDVNVSGAITGTGNAGTTRWLLPMIPRNTTQSVACEFTVFTPFLEIESSYVAHGIDSATFGMARYYAGFHSGDTSFTSLFFSTSSTELFTSLNIAIYGMR